MQSALRQPETNLPLPEEMFSPALPVSIKAVGSYEQVRQSFRRQADQFMDETIVGRVDAALAEYRAKNPAANEFYLSVSSREFAGEEIAYLDEDAQANPVPLRAEADFERAVYFQNGVVSGEYRRELATDAPGILITVKSFDANDPESQIRYLMNRLAYMAAIQRILSERGDVAASIAGQNATQAGQNLQALQPILNHIREFSAHLKAAQGNADKIDPKTVQNLMQALEKKIDAVAAKNDPAIAQAISMMRMEIAELKQLPILAGNKMEMNARVDNAQPANASQTISLQSKAGQEPVNARHSTETRPSSSAYQALRALGPEKPANTGQASGPVSVANFTRTIATGPIQVDPRQTVTLQSSALGREAPRVSAFSPSSVATAMAPTLGNALQGTMRSAPSASVTATQAPASAATPTATTSTAAATATTYQASPPQAMPAQQQAEAAQSQQTQAQPANTSAPVEQQQAHPQQPQQAQQQQAPTTPDQQQPPVQAQVQIVSANEQQQVQASLATPAIAPVTPPTPPVAPFVTTLPTDTLPPTGPAIPVHVAPPSPPVTTSPDVLPATPIVTPPPPTGPTGVDTTPVHVAPLPSPPPSPVTASPDVTPAAPIVTPPPAIGPTGVDLTPIHAIPPVAPPPQTPLVVSPTGAPPDVAPAAPPVQPSAPIEVTSHEQQVESSSPPDNKRPAAFRDNDERQLPRTEREEERKPDRSETEVTVTSKSEEPGDWGKLLAGEQKTREEPKEKKAAFQEAAKGACGDIHCGGICATCPRGGGLPKVTASEVYAM